eukprot:6189047-Pleurochrysis_carterae.AAC.1
MAAGTACPPAALPRQIVALGVRHKRTSDAPDFMETDSSKLTSLKRTVVDEVPAAALVDADANTFRNTRCKLAELLCFAA